MLSASNYILWFVVLMINDETLALSFNQPKIESNATWSENGITFVDNNTLGGPARVFFINNNDTIFIAAHEKSQILIWSNGSITPVRPISVNLFLYTALFVTAKSDIYFGEGNNQGKIEKLTMTSKKTTFVMEFSHYCYGLFVDLNNTLYCSLRNKNRVVKISLDERNPTEITIAGTGATGKATNQLSQPWGIFVNTNFDLYVADAENHRIQLFRSGQMNGTTLAGNGIPQCLNLNFPTDVVLDADGYLYICDNKNDRIIRSGYNRWQCVIGCSGNRGSLLEKLNGAYSLHFDTRGNLYVADEFNNRIQKFTLATNSCETLATTMQTIDCTTSSLSIPSTEESTHLSTLSIPCNCSTEHGIGPYCNISNAICDMLKPCQNGGTCHNKTTPLYSYNCSCLTGFNGKRCEIDNRPCKPIGCWNNGNCINASNGTSYCQCVSGWEGIHCEIKENLCLNVTCQNQGVCRSLNQSYECLCLGDNYYYGRHCEIKTKRLIIFTTVSKSFAYIAILVMVIAAMFIVIMDILKYCFGIDPTRKDLERIRRKKRAKKRKPVIQRFVYVNAPPSSENLNPTVAETTI